MCKIIRLKHGHFEQPLKKLWHSDPTMDKKNWLCDSHEVTDQIGYSRVITAQWSWALELGPKLRIFVSWYFSLHFIYLTYWNRCLFLMILDLTNVDWQHNTRKKCDQHLTCGLTCCNWLNLQNVWHWCVLPGSGQVWSCAWIVLEAIALPFKFFKFFTWGLRNDHLIVWIHPLFSLWGNYQEKEFR